MRKVLLLLFLSGPVFAALPNTTIWEVEGGGNDTNGGGFDSALVGTGTDYSQQSATHVTLNGSSITGTTVGVSSTVVVSGYTVSLNDRGNILNITGGTNFTTGRYEITSVNVGSNQWFLDRNAATAAGLAMTGSMGGALGTIQGGLNSISIADQIVYVESATYVVSSTMTFATVTPSLYQTSLIGYGTTRGDEGMPVIQITSANIAAFNMNESGLNIQNFQLITSTTNATGITVGAASYMTIYNVSISNFKSGIMDSTSGGGIYHIFYRDSVTGASNPLGAIIFLGNNSSIIEYCSFSNNSTNGVDVNAQGIMLLNNVIANNTGIGINVVGADPSWFSNNLVYGNTSDGMVIPSGSGGLNYKSISNNIFAKNGGFGINLAGTGFPTTQFGWHDYNAFWSNTSGNVHGISLAVHDVALSVDPFVNDTGGNFALNNTSNIQNSGYPGFIPGIPNTIGFNFIGPYDSLSNSTKGFSFAN